MARAWLAISISPVFVPIGTAVWSLALMPSSLLDTTLASLVAAYVTTLLIVLPSHLFFFRRRYHPHPYAYVLLGALFGLPYAALTFAIALDPGLATAVLVSSAVSGFVFWFIIARL